MKISLDWLKQYIDLAEHVTPDQIAERLSESVAEVETIERTGEHLASVVVGRITSIAPHPNADRLKVCQVSIGDETVQIVCGGTNISEGMIVAVALPGSRVKWHGQGDPVTLEKTKIRGEESYGMIAAAEELSLERIFPQKIETEIMDLTPYKLAPGADLATALELNDHVFHMENHALTHRPDLFSHRGFAREVAALGLAKWKSPERRKAVSEGNEPMPFDIDTADISLWTHYQGIAVSGLQAVSSPLWMRRRLAAVGTRAINFIVDVTNYVMWDIGMPAHGFDLRKITGRQWLTRLSRSEEKVRTLDGIERTMPEGLIVIENDGKVIDLCGVMGGENSGIEEGTTDVFFHAVAYEPSRIRKAMISLGHRTDAGTIFEKGVDAELPEEGIDAILALIAQEFPKARVVSKRYMKRNEKVSPQTIELPISRVKSLLGVAVETERICGILEALGCGIKKQGRKEPLLQVTVPSYRSRSLMAPEDLIEEIIRIHGYDHLPATVPCGGIQPPAKRPLHSFTRSLREALMAQGLYEEQNLSFLDMGMLEKFSWHDPALLIRIKNPVSEDFAYLRPSLLPWLMHNAGRNYRLKEPMKSFEIQKIFLRRDNDSHESWRCSGIVPEADGVLICKGIVEAIENHLGLCFDFHEAATMHEGHPGKSLIIECNGRQIGTLCELKPAIARNFDLPQGTAVFDLWLEEMLDFSHEVKIYQPISRFPAINLDVSVIVERTVRSNDVWKQIASVAPELLREASLKDIYEAGNLGENKKSLTWSMTYQADDRTLSEKEIQSLLARIVDELEKHGGVVRR